MEVSIYMGKKEVNPETTLRGFLKLRMSHVFSVSSPENTHGQKPHIRWCLQSHDVRRCFPPAPDWIRVIVRRRESENQRVSRSSVTLMGSPDTCWLTLVKAWFPPHTGRFHAAVRGHGQDKTSIIWIQSRFVSVSSVFSRIRYILALKPTCSDVKTE